MCGIFGVINFNGEPVDKEKVLSARDVLAHRGPDDAGIYFSYCHPSQTELSFSRKWESSSIKNTDSLLQGNDKRHSANDNNYTVALAHRRLSIIDLSPAAHQPMGISEALSTKSVASSTCLPVGKVQNQESRYVIIFNGEIYNYKELIPRLTFDVSRLTSSSDTEVILNLYAKYGKDCLSMLRGMFAFAIWDDKEKTLFAARDRFGIKPFYFLHNENEFIFASEIKAIKHYKKNLTTNYNALDAFLRTGSVPAPMTIYNEVKSLLPGHWIEWKMSNVKCQKYWEFGDLFEEDAGQNDQSSMINAQSSKNQIAVDSRLRENDKHKEINVQDKNKDRNTENVISSGDERRRVDKPYNTVAKKNPSNHASMHPFLHAFRYDDDAKKIIRAALLDTMRAHLVADVEVGAFLSGGIDSTAIVSLMRQVGKEKIKTVSIVFPDSKFDESKYSRLAAKYYKTEHIEIPFYEKDLLDDFDNIMFVMDQPTIDGINTYFVSKAAKQAGLKVVLSGLGGDELFGGYPSFNLIPKYQRIKKLPFAKMFMKAAAPLLKNRFPAKAIHYMKNPNEPYAEYKLVRGLFTEEELQKLGWQDKRKKEKEKSEMNTMNDSMTTNDNPHFDYAQCDKEAEGISGLVKVSYLESCYYMRNQLLRDSDVFSMAHSIELRVPFVDHKLYAAVLPYLDDAYDKNFPKKMLVEAVGDLPDEIVHRPKMGFTFPFEDWIRNGQLKVKMNDSMKKLNSNFNLYPFNFDLDKLHWSRLWALYVLNRFREQ